MNNNNTQCICTSTEIPFISLVFLTVLIILYKTSNPTYLPTIFIFKYNIII